MLPWLRQTCGCADVNMVRIQLSCFCFSCHPVGPGLIIGTLAAYGLLTFFDDICTASAFVGEVYGFGDGTMDLSILELRISELPNAGCV
jgi:hypothetical protein